MDSAELAEKARTELAKARADLEDWRARRKRAQERVNKYRAVLEFLSDPTTPLPRPATGSETTRRFPRRTA